ncbi:toxin Cry1Ac domain D-VI-related protein [Listeria cossartiae subsp. cayugensis]|uniref:Toxin Cry1Ac domain D-VI-related protein n=1 Tax=Listeria cossartiae subsp. cayugensis TaxID=2713505 RepID=A0ABU2IRP8_9LIST|nr:toxin Cry1Ac domain D-VI-related protein [Listeria cossartiae]MDT0067277.1 toxin Cry1Ac domain D-VI-related protein [Listeria cossartiae subsp. cayugensis]MDT0081193.1 toxin Cry1Ac domain D-VI-related protein [Listeria cossartiae subsp. cayugensis]MDT0084029.1 toxin Cry1Ac domain D-VI-related protein [Listeria cossartiae subsp. cayugensis]MDT0089503.1 toxin Cry1Ac domain D-VI-related protein [Listeria cossartiae subsp. cayugensis]MDT0100642.1 toxin Cry1Ac domain D-VI-related protein [Lister
MEKKRKIIIGISLAVVVVVLGGGALGFHNYSVKADQKEMALKQNNSEVKALQEEINKYFTNSKKENIVASFKKEDVKVLLEKAKKLPKNLDNAKAMQSITTDIDDLMKMVYAREKVASLLDDQQALAASANIQLVQADVDRLKTKKPVFAEEQQKVIDEANNQKKIIDEATAKVNQLFTSDQKTDVKSGTTREAYNQAKENVSKIKQSLAKENLNKYLDKVSAYVTEEESKSADVNQNRTSGSSNKSTGSSDKVVENEASNSNSSNYSTGSKSNSSSSEKSSKNDSTNKSVSGGTSSGNNKSSGGSTGSSSEKSNGNKSSKPSGNVNPGKINKVTENENGGTDEYFGW